MAIADVHAIVKIGRWYSAIADCNPRFGQYAERIVRSLAIESAPQQGWKPQYPNDPLIDGLFNRFWPAED
jgi:hypothetical protein